MQQGLQGIQQQYGQAMQGGLLDFTQQKLGAQRDVQSEIRSIAMGLIGQDAKGISYGDDDNTNSIYQRVEQMPQVNLGYNINYNGQDYSWSEEEGQYVPI